MPVTSNINSNGYITSTGTGLPIHTGAFGDEYTNVSDGIKYKYTTSWIKDSSPNTSTVVSTASLTIDSNVSDGITLTALATGLTINAPTGSPTPMQPLLLRILDNGTARALTWDAIFRVIGVTLPTTTVINKILYVGCVYNSISTKWDVLSVRQEA